MNQVDQLDGDSIELELDQYQPVELIGISQIIAMVVLVGVYTVICALYVHPSLSTHPTFEYSANRYSAVVGLTRVVMYHVRFFTRGQTCRVSPTDAIDIEEKGRLLDEGSPPQSEDSKK